MHLSVVPVVSVQETELQIHASENVTLECTTSARPSATLSWRTASLKSNFTVTRNGSTAVLQIRNITADDFGDVECVAENLAGIGINSSMLKVHCESILHLSYRLKSIPRAEMLSHTEPVRRTFLPFWKFHETGSGRVGTCNFVFYYDTTLFEVDLSAWRLQTVCTTHAQLLEREDVTLIVVRSPFLTRFIPSCSRSTPSPVSFNTF